MQLFRVAIAPLLQVASSPLPCSVDRSILATRPTAAGFVGKTAAAAAAAAVALISD
jgi:hypothetical protein